MNDPNAEQPAVDPGEMAPKVFILIQLLPNGSVNVQSKGMNFPLMHMLLGTAGEVIREQLRKAEAGPKIIGAPGVPIPGLRG